MKLIIAHLPSVAFGPVRTELSDLGVLRLTVSQAHSATPESSIMRHHRGAALETHLRPELRVECVAADGQSPAVIGVLRGHAGSTGQVAVLDLLELHSPSSEGRALAGDPRLDAVVVSEMA